MAVPVVHHHLVAALEEALGAEDLVLVCVLLGG